MKLVAKFDIYAKLPYPLELTPSAAVHSTNPVCSLDNNTISGTVWWADGRQLPSVVLWLWLSAVLHYSWMVIRLIALYWKDGWTKPPPEPTDSREGVKCWEEYSWYSTVLWTQQHTVDSNTAYSAQCYEHSSTQWTVSNITVWLADCSDQFITTTTVSSVGYDCKVKLLSMMTQFKHQPCSHVFHHPHCQRYLTTQLCRLTF
jgi:hypothetical protein